MSCAGEARRRTSSRMSGGPASVRSVLVGRTLAVAAAAAGGGLPARRTGVRRGRRGETAAATMQAAGGGGDGDAGNGVRLPMMVLGMDSGMGSGGRGGGWGSVICGSTWAVAPLRRVDSRAPCCCVSQTAGPFLCRAAIPPTRVKEAAHVLAGRGTTPARARRPSSRTVGLGVPVGVVVTPHRPCPRPSTGAGHLAAGRGGPRGGGGTSPSGSGCSTRGCCESGCIGGLCWAEA